MSVHQLPDGRWIVWHEKGKDPARPTAQKKYFGRGEEAERAAREFNSSLGLGISKLVKSPAFVELVNSYLDAKRATLAKSTLENLLIKMEGVILPAIGDIPAHMLTPDRLDKYVTERARLVKLTTIHRELSDIRAVIRWAVSRRLIAASPMEWFSLPKRDDARLQPPTKAEFDAILSCALPHLKRAMLISYHTGLRPGKEELLPLTWEAVDFIGKTLMVTSAVKGGLPVRMVPLNKTILAHLNTWYTEDEKTGMRYLVHYHGGRIDNLSKSWKAAKRRARVLRRIRMYDIRHASISRMLEMGGDLKSVSEIAGHSDVSMTARVYQRVTNKMKRTAVDFLE